MKAAINKIFRGIYLASAVFLPMFALYTAATGAMVDVIQRGTVLLLVLIMVYSKSAAREDYALWKKIIGLLLLIGGGAALCHQIVNFRDVANNLGSISLWELLLGIALVVAIWDVTRRTIGWPIVIISAIFALYAYLGPYMPGALSHRGYNLTRIISHFYIGTNGIFGTPLGTASTMVIMFIIFGAFLEASGGASFFMDLAIALTGKSRGGPAKAAVVSSALMGTISGSAASNVVTTGTFTIPLMKRTGYSSHVAGAIEAVASTGGQIMPPVMGAAAFIMAEMIGIPYRTIALAAVIPAALYYITCFGMVHFEAVKTGVHGLKSEEIPVLKQVWSKNWHTLISVVVLIGSLAMGYSAMRSALYGTIAAIVCSFFRRHTRLTLKKLVDALVSSSENVVAVVIACACAGIIIGSVSLTGLGLKLSSLIIAASGGHLLLALVFTLIVLIILGMGMPTAAAYIMVATLVAPGLVDMGLTMLQAHMFCLYGAVLSAITPPVALAAYAASGIAKANPLKIGFTACKIGVVAFIIPFFFAYQQALLWVGSAPEILLAFCTAAIGSLGLAVGMEGCYRAPLNWLQRIGIVVAALLMIYPGVVTDLVGLAGIVLILLPQHLKKGSAKAETTL